MHYDTLLDKFPELSQLCVIIIIFGFGLNIESYTVLPEFVCACARYLIVMCGQLHCSAVNLRHIDCIWDTVVTLVYLWEYRNIWKRYMMIISVCIELYHNIIYVHFCLNRRCYTWWNLNFELELLDESYPDSRFWMFIVTEYIFAIFVIHHIILGK